MIQRKFGPYLPDKEIFKDYLLRDFIGRGRYGTVYLVENRIRRRALKVFSDELHLNNGGDAEPLDYLYTEKVNKFYSPYMVDIIDYGETVSGESCLVMEYIDETLEKILDKKGILDTHEASHYFISLLKALKVQEQHGIVHGNLKPSNLFMTADTVKISDYALYLFSSKKKKPDYPEYCAPELFQGEYSHSADRWAAAVILFRMMAGEMPFPCETPGDIKKAVLNTTPDYAWIPEIFIPFFQSSFQKDPANRHTSAREMLEEFAGLSFSLSPCASLLSAHLNPVEPVSSSVVSIPGTVESSTLPTPDAARGDSSPSCSLEVPLPPCETEAIAPEPTQVLSKKSSVTLRKSPVMVSEDDFQKIFGLDDNGRPLNYIESHYEDNGNGTITDHATGLMWQQSGSEKGVTHEKARDYIYRLNKEKFAGYSDWRMPTIAELLSLMEPERFNDNLHIDPLFDSLQQWCWSADIRTTHSGWFVFYYLGNVHWDFFDLDNYARGVR